MKRRLLLVFNLLLALFLSATVFSPVHSATMPSLPPGYEAISVDAAGNLRSGSNPSISADGNYVAFELIDPNLVDGDTNNTGDIFLRDRRNATTTRISVTSNGDQADGDLSIPSISGDGRYVVYVSNATNLVSGDTNNLSDVFLYDNQTRTTIRISIGPGGTQADGMSYNPRISADGHYVVFASQATTLVPDDTNNVADIYLYNVQDQTLSRVSVNGNGEQANGASNNPSITADDRYIIYSSAATNLVPGDANGYEDVFRYDTQTGEVTLVSINDAGEQANDACIDPLISANGRFIGFSSYASNLVPNDTNNGEDIFVYDLQMHKISIWGPVSGDYWNVTFTFSFNGWDFAYEDHEATVQTYYREMHSGSSILVPFNNDWSQGGVSLSADGHILAYTQDSPEVNVYPAIFVRTFSYQVFLPDINR